MEICSDFLKKQLHPSNCLGIRAFADAQGVTELWRSANEYTSEHIMEVMRNQEFVLLPTDHVIALLGNDDLNIPCEETILGAVLDWVKYDLSARKKHLAKLLAQVCFDDYPLNEIKWSRHFWSKAGYVRTPLYHLSAGKTPTLVSSIPR